MNGRNMANVSRSCAWFFLAVFGLAMAQAPAFGFGWGIALPQLPPLPGAPMDDPAPPLNNLPPVDPVDPVVIGDMDGMPPPADPNRIDETPEPATIITALTGVCILGAAGWRRYRQQRSS